MRFTSLYLPCGAGCPLLVILVWGILRSTLPLARGMQEKQYNSTDEVGRPYIHTLYPFYLLRTFSPLKFNSSEKMFYIAHLVLGFKDIFIHVHKLSLLISSFCPENT
jgi:hypothetical protein